MTRINEAIRAENVRLVGPEGEQIGIKSRQEALDLAIESNLDLVEVAPNADPPVCRVLDYGKYKYELEQKAKQARKHQSTIVVKEIKFRPKIGVHDYNTKKGHVERFLRKNDKVKITIMFRGREVVHPKKGEELLRRLAEDVAELGVIESEPNLDGRNMVMVLGPIK
ncbi:MAG: translation initiation factor IF-3 [Thermoleophilia bacterium]